MLALRPKVVKAESFEKESQKKRKSEKKWEERRSRKTVRFLNKIKYLILKSIPSNFLRLIISG